MPTPAPRRRFTLLDALIFVVPAAVGAFTFRSYQRDAGHTFLAGWFDNSAEDTLLSGPFDIAYGWKFPAYLDLGVKCVEPALAALTVGLFVIRLIPPRPRRLRLMRQPGMAALLAVLVVLAVNAVVLAATLIGVGYVPAKESYFLFGPPLYEHAGAAVVAAWVALGASGRWRSEASWVDRAGRLVGAVWVVVFLTAMLVSYWVSATLYKGNVLPAPAPLAAEDKAEKEFQKKYDALDAEITGMLERQRQMLSDGTPPEEYAKLNAALTKKLNEQTEMLHFHYPNTTPGPPPPSPVTPTPPRLTPSEPSPSSKDHP